MKNTKELVLDYTQVPLKIIFKGIYGVKRYKLIPSADQSGITINKDI
ncbi:MAG: hypothetical protein PHN84_07930 [Desulfuromonadaceae bacterium]|nr:hypothetical protein [Desulfuromonadaceae bacterium]MDD2854761.1 hypothetical protein [Desulfuromonadaceae bacterium]